jgi:hypothetical protein
MEHDLSHAQWRKAARSGANNDCVEVARNLPGIVAIRDSKNPDGPALVIAPADFDAFTAAVTSGEPGPC